MGSSNYITRRLLVLPSVDALADDDVPFERQERSDKGVAVKLTPRKDEAMREQALKWGFDFSFQEMADFLIELFGSQHPKQPRTRTGLCLVPQASLKKMIGKKSRSARSSSRCIPR